MSKLSDFTGRTAPGTRGDGGVITEPNVKDHTGGTMSIDVFASLMEASVRSRIGSARFEMWFRHHTSFRQNGDGVVVTVPSEHFQAWLGESYRDVLTSAAVEVLGFPVTVRFEIDTALLETVSETSQPKSYDVTLGSAGVVAPLASAVKTPAATTSSPSTTRRVATRSTLFGDEIVPPAPPPRISTRVAQKGTDQPQDRENSRRWKSLAEFMTGPCNRVAHAAAQSAVEEPGEGANPLVFHGPVGTGKTHLLEGIYLGLRKSRPTFRPRYITAEDFTSRFVHASRSEKHTGFRRFFRECSALLLDDLQFLASKPATQREFVQTLDVLLAEGRQVVVTMDSHPRLADELMPALVDRLLAGAVWSVQPPDETTRLAILKFKSSRCSPPIPEDALGILASGLKGNVRELEGAIHGVRHFSRATGRPVNASLVREALGDLLRHSVRTVSIVEIDAAVCRVLGLTKGALQSNGRSWAVSHPRMVAIYLCRKHTNATYGEIAKHFGGKTHSTAVAAEKKVRHWIDRGEKLAVGDRECVARDVVERTERELSV